MEHAPRRTTAGDYGSISASEHIKPMRGGAQAQLMRCRDGHLYVVKFRNNPQGVRVLANELIASSLAKLIGLTVPPAAIVSVDESLIQCSPGLRVQLANRAIPFESGLHFGSQCPIDPVEGRIQDWLPAGFVGRVRNSEEFAGILAFDKWAGNHDNRQAVLCRRGRERKYTAFFIDFGYCFGAENWTFPDCSLRGAFWHNEMYTNIRGWEGFEPWLSRLEELDPDTLWEITGSVPPLWYDSDWDALSELTETLLTRRTKIRDLILEFRDSPRHPFPKWGQKQNYWLSDLDYVNEHDNLPTLEAVG